MEILNRILFSLIITLIIIRKAYKKKSLSLSGCIAAFFVGFFVTLSSLAHLGALFSFFYFSNKATRFRQDKKKKYDHEFKEDGQRDCWQVLSNGFFATLLSIFYLIECGYGEKPIDFANEYKASWYSIAILASLACCCGDTLSSELGTAFGRQGQKVFHLVKWKDVPKGTNGGMSLIGTLAGVLGGFLVGFAYYFCLKICVTYQEIKNYRIIDLEMQLWPIIFIGALSGFLGSLVDSILGGYFQYSGLNKSTGQISNKPGKNIEHVSGFNLLSNNQVNWLSCMIITFFMPCFSFEFYKFFLIDPIEFFI